MNKEDFYKKMENLENKTNEYLDLFRNVVWEDKKDSSEIFNDLEKSEQIALIQVYSAIVHLSNTVRFYNNYFVFKDDK